MVSVDDYPRVLKLRGPDGEAMSDLELRPELHNERPAWDLVGSLHHSLCWTPYDDDPSYGFWSLCNLWTMHDGQATGFVFDTPEKPIGDGPVGLPPTATQSMLPPLGWWTRGRPWAGDRTSGGRVHELLLPK